VLRSLQRAALARITPAALVFGSLLGTGSALAAGAAPAEPELIPVDPATIAARERSLAEDSPDGAKLVAYLSCGQQRESVTTDAVKISLVRGEPYRFMSEAAEVLTTQPTIFFDATHVVLQASGLDREKRYNVGLTWWDYDNGSRTQSVIVSSPDGRLVRLAVPAIRLPDYTDSGQLPAERRFTLPVTFARDGRVQFTIECVTGANAVISELWIWEVP
jgi:hypothetical protein